MSKIVVEAGLLVYNTSPISASKACTGQFGKGSQKSIEEPQGSKNPEGVSRVTKTLEMIIKGSQDPTRILPSPYNEMISRSYLHTAQSKDLKIPLTNLKVITQSKDLKILPGKPQGYRHGNSNRKTK